MKNPENETQNRGLLSRLGAKGILAGSVALAFGLDSARVLALAPTVHALNGDHSYHLPPEYIGAGVAEAVIALGAAAYAVKQYRAGGELDNRGDL